MKNSIGQQTKSQSAAQAGFVKQEFRKGYQVPLLTWQKYGVLSKMLWPSKNQIIRIIPGYDPATGEIFRQNINCGDYSQEEDPANYLSDTFITATTVSRFGSLTAPLIADYEPGSEDEQKYGGDTVLHNFIRGIMYACSNQTKRKRLKPINEWLTWTGLGPQGTLSYDKPSLLMQALVFHVNGKNNQDYDSDDERDLVDDDGEILPLLSVVAIDNKTSIANLMHALTEPKENDKPLDSVTNSKLGPMAEPEGYKLFLNTYQDQGHAALRPSVQASGKGWTPTQYDIDPENVKMLWRPWEELLYYMTAQEQLELCAREYGADTVNYVIGTDPKFTSLTMPEHIKNAGFGRYASLVGGSVQLSSNNYGNQTQGKPTAGLSKGLGKGLAAASAKAPLAGAVTSSVSKEDLANEVSRLRAAANGQSQAQDAQDLLGDPDLNENDVQ